MKMHTLEENTEAFSIALETRQSLHTLYCFCTRSGPDAVIPRATGMKELHLFDVPESKFSSTKLAMPSYADHRGHAEVVVSSVSRMTFSSGRVHWHSDSFLPGRTPRGIYAHTTASGVRVPTDRSHESSQPPENRTWWLKAPAAATALVHVRKVADDS